MTNEEIRPAVAADVPTVKALTDAAYEHYIERIGRVPQPMERDHAANVAAGQVFVTGDPVVGLVVVEEYPDHLYLDNIAVRPDAQGQGVGDGCCDSSRHTRVRWGCPRSGSTRTR